MYNQTNKTFWQLEESPVESLNRKQTNRRRYGIGKQTEFITESFNVSKTVFVYT